MGTSPKTSSTPQPTTPPRKPRRWLYGVIAAVAVVVVIAVIGFVGIPQNFSFELTEHLGAHGYTGSYNESFPEGAKVSGNWKPALSYLVQLLILTPSGTLIYNASGSTGSPTAPMVPPPFSFTVSESHYQFVVNCVANTSVSVSGSYSAPWF